MLVSLVALVSLANSQEPKAKGQSLELEVDEGLHTTTLELDDKQHDEGEEQCLTDERHAADATLEGTEGALRDEVGYEA